MNLPKPLPGTVNCVSCHQLSKIGCEECRRCQDRCGCICQGCWNCTPTKMIDGVRKWDRSERPVAHHPKYFCQTCRKCKRVNSDGLVTHQCICARRPSAVRDLVVEKHQMEFNHLTRPLGLEIEVSYVATTRLEVPAFVKYQWVHDGSITSGGQELVLNKLVGDQFLQGITALAENFAQHGFEVDRTCGFHVHVGADEEGFRAYELRRLILLYQKFEDVFYHLVAKGRDGYRMVRDEKKYYAKRWGMPPSWYEGLALQGTSKEIKRYILEWLYEGRLQYWRDGQGSIDKLKVTCKLEDGKHPYMPWPIEPRVVKVYGRGANMAQIRAHKYENCRYLGLNLHTWFQRGTVEYRMHEGTLDVEKLLYWPLWCGWFTEVASVLTDTEVANLSTLDQLLDGEWKRPYKVTMIPQPVKDWVRRTLGERGHSG